MEAKKLCCVLAVVAVLAAIQPQVSAQTPMGTAFTYQGRLTDGGSPANGSYDLEFTLYENSEGTAQVGDPIPVEDKQVTNGLFTVKLDFGSAVFTGEARWLEIGVRPGASTDPHTPLAPRQEVTPTPYALQTRGLFVDSVANVGIGTPNPSAKLTIADVGSDQNFGNSAVYIADGNKYLDYAAGIVIRG